MVCPTQIAMSGTFGTLVTRVIKFSKGAELQYGSAANGNTNKMLEYISLVTILYCNVQWKGTIVVMTNEDYSFSSPDSRFELLNETILFLLIFYPVHAGNNKL